MTKTATRPGPRSSQSHSHSHRTSAKIPSNTPLSQPARVVASVGQAYPPNSVTFRRSPSADTDVRTPSPNYFGLIVDPASDPRESGAGPIDNWSPPTSSILSFGAASPKHLPLDSNPDFEAFKRQTEENQGFNLSHGNLAQFASTPGAHPRPRPDRRPARSETQEHPSPRSKPQVRDATPESMDLDGRSASSDQTRASLAAPSFFDMPRRDSPVNMNLPISSTARSTISRLDGRHPRLSLPQNRADPPSPLHTAQNPPQQRADTLPASLEDGPAMISAIQLRDMLERLPPSEFLLLDLRVYHHFSQSRIQGALNVCIPTTLLKRPSFNLQKLQDTFTTESEKARFSQWRNCPHLIVYDACSSEKKDAVSAVNTLKKFENEGWHGTSYILRGGYFAFSKKFPKFIDHDSASGGQQSSVMGVSVETQPGVAPVAGGCAMPPTKNAANPFFSNIRQNQDLIGGVGQMDIKIPEELCPESQNILPRWLSKAAAQDNHGKLVAEKFLQLELAEQSRMTKALSSGVSYGNSAADSKNVQIAGIEKGGKNRYNNIWPFEHARVKLQGRPAGACDYVNASHIRTPRSNKHYIASQGPLPATFEDFWSVVWDQDVRVIVMLTAESEGGLLKCHSYWGSKVFGPMKLTALSERKVSLDSKSHRTSADRRERDAGRRRANTTAEAAPPPSPVDPPHVIIRKFTLSHSSHPFSPIREITQIHYSSWPDFGAPASPAQLLGLVELSNVIQRASASPTSTTRSDEPETQEASRPMLVHCSAGCGRTGTFCTIDSVIDMLKRQRKERKSGTTPMEFTSSGSKKSIGSDFMLKDVNASTEGDWVFNQDLDLIEKTVEDFRGQRLSMVQSLRQYVLCYETVIEWITQQHFGSSRPNIGRERSGSET